MTTLHGDNVHHMRVTASGQVSVPAPIRRRWATTRVRIVDRGDHLVVEPEPENPFAGLQGALAGPGPSSDELRRELRKEEAHAEDRRLES